MSHLGHSPSLILICQGPTNLNTLSCIEERRRTFICDILPDLWISSSAARSAIFLAAMLGCVVFAHPAMARFVTVAPSDVRALIVSVKQTPKFSYVEPNSGTVWFD
jgi:hypothetical protein